MVFLFTNLQPHLCKHKSNFLITFESVNNTNSFRQYKIILRFPKCSSFITPQCFNSVPLIAIKSILCQFQLTSCLIRFLKSAPLIQLLISKQFISIFINQSRGFISKFNSCTCIVISIFSV